jgi:CRISPR-associated protein Csc3
LRDINFFTIRRQLEGKDITVADLLALEAFTTSEQEVMRPQVYRDDEEAEETGESDEAESEAANNTAERGYIKFQPSEFPGLFLFGTRVGKDDDDTSTWAMPAFLALALPLVTGTKVVISEMSLPLFSSGRDFQETVVFDAPHAYLDRLLKGKRVRVNRLLPKLRLLASIYRVNIDTYARQGRPEWQHLSAIARDLDSDPLYLFSYLRKQQRSESLYGSDVALYLHIYELLEGDLSKIQHCVNKYIVFYRGGFKTHSILKPIDIVAKAIINSPPTIDKDDLLWQIQGELKNWLDRVRGKQATGYAMLWGKDIDEKEAPAIEDFVRCFYQEVFVDFCEGERGLLRSRINRFKDGCEAYYVHQRNLHRFQEPEAEPEAASVTL